MPHALFGPSVMARRLACVGSAAMERGMPDSTSAFAAEGTAAHALLELALIEGASSADTYVGRAVGGGTARREVDRATADAITLTLGDVAREAAALRLAGFDVTVMPEVQVPIDHVTGEAGASGTADVVIVGTDGDRWRMVVVDLKYGKGVRVLAERNEQLMMYALGAQRVVQDMLGLAEPELIRVAISQPRVTETADVWETTHAELQEFAENVKHACAVGMACIAAKADAQPITAHLTPTVKGCQFCKAKTAGPDGEPICPGLRGVIEDMIADFPTLETAAKPNPPTAALVALDVTAKSPVTLSAAMAAVGVIEDWCAAVRADCERRMLRGEPVPGFKLVRGREGSRNWRDDKEAEGAMKLAGIAEKDLYDVKLISPTSAEKLVKSGKFPTDAWTAMQDHITRKAASLSVAPESDKRPAETVGDVTNDFTVAQ